MRSALGAGLVASIVAVGVGAPASAVANKNSATTQVDVCPSSVFVIGDSLTDKTRGGAGKYTPAVFKKLGIKSQVYGRNGLSTRSALQERYRAGLGSPQARKASTWVIALGTNDQVRYGFQNRVRNIMRLAKGKTVYWVNTRSPASWQEGPDGPINRVLRVEEKRHKRLHVINFRKQALKQRGVFAGDRVHMTTKGYKWRAGIYASPFVKKC